MDLEANPTLKTAVLRVAERLRGTPQFVEIVRDFHLSGQEDALIGTAIRNPRDSAAAEALHLVIAAGHVDKIRSAIASAEGPALESLAHALANSTDPKVVPLLCELLEDPRPSSDLRTTALQGLSRTEAGATEILKLARARRLDDPAMTTAALLLSQVRWPSIRGEAAAVVPLPRAGDGDPLPPIAELVRQKGDPTAGAAVFRTEQVGCIKCHRVGSEGADFGPGLSQIGGKLGKEALYEAILDPSAGISFGYEGWTIETRDGEETFGILTSDTPEEIAVKQQSGVTAHIPTARITSRQRQALSIMPAGLAQLMTRRQLVDLVEYLTTLKGEAAK